MERGKVGLAVAALAGVPILLSRASDPSLLRDTDTAVLLIRLRERADPLSWFAGDWPLGNHFFRPISTLTFELDAWLYGDRASGFGLTNALLAYVCVLLLYWFVRELTDRPFVAAACAALFAAWNVDAAAGLSGPAMLLAGITFLVGALRHGSRWWRYLPAVLVLAALAELAPGVEPLWYRVIGWLPGRTASVMTLFALIAMAAYARYERLGATRGPPPPSTPLTPPATKGTRAQPTPTGRPVGWAFLSVLATALALGSYEQAVMLPAVLLGVALTLRFRRYRVRWGWQAAFWGLLVGYLLLRRALIPPAPSGYQKQQLRTGLGGVFLSLADFAFPALGGIWEAGFLLEQAPLIFLTAKPYLYVLGWARDLTTFYQARRQWVLALAGWAMAVLAFLPMAWLKPFAHYYYWPMALRSMLVVAIAMVAGELIVIAWSPPERKAPPRRAPAPGSLPRR